MITISILLVVFVIVGFLFIEKTTFFDDNDYQLDEGIDDYFEVEDVDKDSDTIEQIWYKTLFPKSK